MLAGGTVKVPARSTLACSTDCGISATDSTVLVLAVDNQTRSKISSLRFCNGRRSSRTLTYVCFEVPTVGGVAADAVASVGFAQLTMWVHAT